MNERRGIKIGGTKCEAENPAGNQIRTAQRNPWMPGSGRGEGTQVEGDVRVNVGIVASFKGATKIMTPSENPGQRKGKNNTVGKEYSHKK